MTSWSCYLFVLGISRYTEWLTCFVNSSLQSLELYAAFDSLLQCFCMQLKECLDYHKNWKKFLFSVHNRYIVTGDVAGHVRFLDQQLRLTNWLSIEYSIEVNDYLLICVLKSKSLKSAWRGSNNWKLFNNLTLSWSKRVNVYATLSQSTLTLFSSNTYLWLPFLSSLYVTKLITVLPLLSFAFDPSQVQTLQCRTY